MPTKQSTKWPEGLNDNEALQRLETLCRGACSGIQDLSDDARYKALRKALLARPEYRVLAPPFIAAQPSLEALVRYLRSIKNRQEREETVRKEFHGLHDFLGNSEGFDADKWTGRRSKGARAALVKALAPVALEAVQTMIEAEEHARGNGGPVDEDRDEALQHLKNLYEALGELIRLVNSERPIDKAISKVVWLGNSSKLAMAKLAAGTPVTAASVLAFSTVAGIAEMLVGNVVVTVAAGGVAGNAMKDALLKSKPAQ